MPGTIQDLIDSHGVISGTNNGSQLYFLTHRTKQGAPVHALEKSRLSQTLSNQFKLNFVTELGSICTDPDIQVVEYDPDFVSNQPHIEYLDIPAVQRMGVVLTGISNKDQLGYFEPGKRGSMGSIQAYIVCIEANNEKYIYFRKYSTSKALSSTLASRVIYREGTFERFNENVLLFDAAVDGFVTPTAIYVLRKSPFEQVFNHRSVYEQSALAAIRQLENMNLISNIDDFRNETIADFRKVKKVHAIGKRLGFSAMTAIELADISSRWNCGVQFDPTTKRIVHTKETMWQILRLLGNDNLESPLTNEKFQVQAKVKK